MRWLSVLLAVGGCGSFRDNVVSCDFRVGDDPEDRCQERTGVQASDAFGATCAALGADDIDGECPERDQIVGGCMTWAPGGDVIDWYYEPMTLEEVQATCDDDGLEFVEP